MKHGSERDQERARTADVLKERNALGVDRRSISDSLQSAEQSPIAYMLMCMLLSLVPDHL